MAFKQFLESHGGEARNVVEVVADMSGKIHMKRRGAIFNLYDPPVEQQKRKRGGPRKYGKKLGNASSLASRHKRLAKEYCVTGQ